MFCPSDYEKRAIREIHDWKNPTIGWIGQAMALINWPLDKAGDAIFNAPGVGNVMTAAVNGLISLLNDVANWSVRPDAIRAMAAFDDQRMTATLLEKYKQFSPDEKLEVAVGRLFDELAG